MLCARRADRLAALAARLRFALPGAELLELQLDVTDTGAVMALPKRIEGTPFEKVRWGAALAALTCACSQTRVLTHVTTTPSGDLRLSSPALFLV